MSELEQSVWSEQSELLDQSGDVESSTLASNLEEVLKKWRNRPGLIKLAANRAKKNFDRGMNTEEIFSKLATDLTTIANETDSTLIEKEDSPKIE